MHRSKRCCALAAVATSLVLAGCRGSSEPDRPFSISGAVSGAIASGVTMTLTGTATASATTDANGAYAFGSLPNGTYTVTPSRAGYLFRPPSVAVTVAGASVGDRRFTATNGLTVLAGVPSGSGNVDGTGAAAGFSWPYGVAVDGSGNVYVADGENHVIRKITAAGATTTIAGTAGQPGSADGTGADARFHTPRGVAVDGSGNVYVADTENQTIRKISPSGVVTTLAGAVGQLGSDDGVGAAATFYRPYGVAVDGSGNVYVADSCNYVVRKITPDGVVTTLAGTAGQYGSLDGTGAAASFTYTNGVAVDAAGNVYVADTENHTIRRISAAGVVTTIAGAAGQVGAADGAGPDARFNYPYGVAVDGPGNVYVADTENHTIRRISPAGAVTTIAGAAGQPGSAEGAAADARFDFPCGVAVDGSGNVYVADTQNHAIRKIAPLGMVTTLAGMPRRNGSADGAAADARFSAPAGVAVDASGNVWVADTENHVVRKVTPAGAVSTVAGTPGQPGSADATGADARFDSPMGLAVDASGNVYVADTWNHTIRKITPAGVVTTLAGAAGQPGSADGAGVDARFSNPIGVAVDASGNVYVGDHANHAIRMITAAGEVSTFAGTSGQPGSADATGPDARFTYPRAVAVDGSGNVYVADTGNHAVRKITPARAVETLAGTAGQAGSADGAGTVARFDSPHGVAVDGSGNVWVADTENGTVRRIAPGGVVTTVVGVASRRGTVAGPLPATLALPVGVAFDPTTGNLFVVLPDALVEAWL